MKSSRTSLWFAVLVVFALLVSAPARVLHAQDEEGGGGGGGGGGEATAPAETPAPTGGDTGDGNTAVASTPAQTTEEPAPATVASGDGGTPTVASGDGGTPTVASGDSGTPTIASGDGGTPTIASGDGATSVVPATGGDTTTVPAGGPVAPLTAGAADSALAGLQAPATATGIGVGTGTGAPIVLASAEGAPRDGAGATTGTGIDAGTVASATPVVANAGAAALDAAATPTAPVPAPAAPAPAGASTPDELRAWARSQGMVQAEGGGPIERWNYPNGDYGLKIKPEASVNAPGEMSTGPRYTARVPNPSGGYNYTNIATGEVGRTTELAHPPLNLAGGGGAATAAAESPGFWSRAAGWGGRTLGVLGSLPVSAALFYFGSTSPAY